MQRERIYELELEMKWKMKKKTHWNDNYKVIFYPLKQIINRATNHLLETVQVN